MIKKLTISLLSEILAFESQRLPAIGSEQMTIPRHSLISLFVTNPNEAKGANEPLSATKKGVGSNENKRRKNMNKRRNEIPKSVKDKGEVGLKAIIDKRSFGSLPKPKIDVVTT